MVKTLRTIGGKNRKFQNHPVYHRGNRKAAGWSKESREGGTPGQDAADCDLGALGATPEQPVGARRGGGAEPLALLGNFSTPRPRTEEILQHGREGEAAPKCPQLRPRGPCSEVPHCPSSPPSGSPSSFSLMPDQGMTLVTKVPFRVPGRGLKDFNAVAQFLY